MRTITGKKLALVTIGTFIAFTSVNAAADPCEKFLSGKRKLSKWITAPLGLAAWTAFFVYADHWADQREIGKFKSAIQQDIYGSDTMGEWLLTGGLPPKTAREIYNSTLDRFQDHLMPMRERLNDFARLKWWNSESVRLANQILDRVGKDPNAVIVRSDLINEITSDPDYPSLEKRIGDAYNFSLNLWLMPRVNYLGKLDIDWLAILFNPAQDSQWTQQQRTGLEAIREMYDFDRSRVSFVVLIELTANTLKSSKSIDAKLEKAKKLGLPIEKPTFSRADLPIPPEIFKDGNKWHYLNDEVDRWNLMLKDPRFKAEAEAWRQGQLGDVLALTEFGKHWHLLENRSAGQRP